MFVIERNSVIPPMITPAIPAKIASNKMFFCFSMISEQILH